MEPANPDTASPELVPLSVAIHDRRLADFAGRVLLALNLLQAAYLTCEVIVWIPPHRSWFASMNAKLPAVTELLMSMPPASLCATILGVAAGLIVLEAVSRSRRLRIVVNAWAMACLLLGGMLMQMALRMPMISIGISLQGR